MRVLSVPAWIAFRRLIWQSIYFCLVGVVLFLLWSPQYRGLERKLEDLMAQVWPREPRADVVLIDITEADWKLNFGGRRKPIDSAVLQRLILRAAEAKPRILAIDIDTTDETFRALASTQWPEGVTLVWARDAAPSRDAPDKWVAAPFLGGASVGDGIKTGIALMVDDPDDGKTRSYERRFLIDQSDHMDSLPAAIAKAFLGNSYSAGLLGAIDRPRAIAFSRADARVTFDAGDILLEKSEGALPWREAIKDRIALIGGSYDDADRHPTPVGTLNGMHVVADAVETELNGGGTLRLSALESFVIAVVVYLVSGLLVEWFEQPQMPDRSPRHLRVSRMKVRPPSAAKRQVSVPRFRRLTHKAVWQRGWSPRLKLSLALLAIVLLLLLIAPGSAPYYAIMFLFLSIMQFVSEKFIEPVVPRLRLSLKRLFP